MLIFLPFFASESKISYRKSILSNSWKIRPYFYKYPETFKNSLIPRYKLKIKIGFAFFSVAAIFAFYSIFPSVHLLLIHVNKYGLPDICLTYLPDTTGNPTTLSVIKIMYCYLPLSVFLSRLEGIWMKRRRFTFLSNASVNLFCRFVNMTLRLRLKFRVTSLTINSHRGRDSQVS